MKIKTLKEVVFRRFAYAAASALAVFSVVFLCPPSEETSSAATSPVVSNTTLTVYADDITVDAKINPDGTSSFFTATSNLSISTNNYSGYTLRISAENEETYDKLLTESGEYYLSSITAATSETDFKTSNSFLGKFGYKPSKLNSAANTSYIPAPTAEGDILDVTEHANQSNESNSYEISLATKLDITTPSGEYYNSYIYTVVPNPVPYMIAYDKNTNDDVANLPETQINDTAETSMTLSDDTPVRAHYSFLGWCEGTTTTTENVDSCDGNIYQPGDTYYLDQTTNNSTTMKAMWSVNRYTVTINTGNGIDSLTMDGWTDAGAGTFTKTYQYGANIDLSSITPTYKLGYNNTKYIKNDNNGSLENNIYTVGDGDGNITISAADLTTPVCEMQGGTTKVYNRSATTITATDNSSSYADTVDITYSFGYAGNATDTLSNFSPVQTTNTFSVAKAGSVSAFGWGNYRGARHYGVVVVVADKSDSTITATCTSGTGSSTGTTVNNRASITLVNSRIDFNANGGTVSGTSKIYVHYDGAVSATYTGRTNNTKVAIPTATYEGRTFVGWYTAAEGGDLVLKPGGTFADTAVSGWIGLNSNNEMRWRKTGTSDSDKVAANQLYAHYSLNAYTVTLDANGGAEGSSSTLVSYNDTTLGSITNPIREDVVDTRTISGFTTDRYDANDAVVTFSSENSSNCMAANDCKSTSTTTYTLTGWYKEAGATNLVATNATTPVLQANTDYTDAEGKWISTSDQTLYAGWTSSTSAFEQVTLPEITKTGYTCGWAANASGATAWDYTSGSSFVPAGASTTLYGYCTPNTYSLSITFAGTGVNTVKVCKTSGNCSGTNLLGTVSTSGGQVNGLIYNTSYYLYPSYTTGYGLSKWAKTSTEGVLSSTSAGNPTFTIGAGNGAVTITGKAKAYTVTLDQNNATTNSDPTSVKATYNSATLPAITNPQRKYTITFDDANNTGCSVPATNTVDYTYTFNGWTTAVDGDTTLINNSGALAASVSGYTDENGKWIKTSNTTVYAKWDNPSSFTMLPSAKTGHTCKWTDGANTYDQNTAYTSTSFSPTGNVTLHAVDTANRYKITLNNRSATTAGSTSVYATYGSNELSAAITNPSRTHTISGFTLDETATGATVSSTNTISHSLVFNGWWSGTSTSNNVRVIDTSGALIASTSDANGTYTDASRNWILASGKTLYSLWSQPSTGVTLPTITKTGYTCSWTTSDGATTYNSGNTNVKITKNIELIGSCTIKSNLSLKVSFDSTYVTNVEVRSGSASGDLVGTVSTSGNTVSGLTFGTAYYLVPTYTTGSVLDSWAKDSGAVGTLSSTSDANPTYTIGDGTNAVTLNAKRQQYTITLNKNGGTNSSTSSVKVSYGDTTLGAIATMPVRSYSITGFTAPTGATVTFSGDNISNCKTATTCKSNYTFNGWYKETGATNLIASNASTPVLQASTSYTDADGKWIYTGNRTLYAGWTAGTGTGGAQVTLPEITKTGYTCKWSDGTTEYASGAAVTPASNLALTGVCTAKKYKITLNQNSATTNSSPTSVNATYDSSSLSSSITNPQREYTIEFDTIDSGCIAGSESLTYTYTFAGWTTTKNGSTTLIDTNGTLAAGVSNYTDANSKWVRANTATAYAKWTNQSFTMPTLTRTGYTCKWNTADNGTGTSYTQNAITNSFAPTDSPTILYAIEEPNEYTITLNQNGATTPGTESVTVIYGGDDINPSIVNPVAVYTMSGFNNVPSGAIVSNTTNITSRRSFTGWTTQAAGGSRVINSDGSLRAGLANYTDENGNWIRANNLTLYARWESKGEDVTLPTISLSGYTCKWSDGTKTIASGGKYEKPEGDTVFTGVCEYTITLDLTSNGGFNDDAKYNSVTLNGTPSISWTNSSYSSTGPYNYTTTKGSSVTLPTINNSYISGNNGHCGWTSEKARYANTIEYSSGETVVIAEGNTTLYPVCVTTFAEAGITANSYLQDFTQSMCSKVTSGQTITLKDSRDDKGYIIGRIGDDCWMLDNLRLNIKNVSESDLATKSNGLSSSIITSLMNGGGNPSDSSPTGSLTRVTSTSIGTGTESNPLTWFSKGIYYIDEGSGNRTTDDPLSEANGWKEGYFYNVCAASGGSYCYGGPTYSQSNVPSGDIQNDICPTRWKIGDINDFASIAKNNLDPGWITTVSKYDSSFGWYGTDYDELRLGFHLGLNGYISGYNGTAAHNGVGEYAYMLTSNLEDNAKMDIYYYLSNYDDFDLGTPSLLDSYDRKSGFSIRCKLK